MSTKRIKARPYPPAIQELIDSHLELTVILVKASGHIPRSAILLDVAKMTVSNFRERVAQEIQRADKARVGLLSGKAGKGKK